MPPLGFIRHQDRTQKQWDVHYDAEKRMGRFALPTQHLAKGEKIILSGLWKDPLIVADLGFTFERFGQYTGSCIGVSLGNAITTLAAVQRMLAVAPTKMFLCFWPFDYGRCRYNEGDHGQGEGAMNSSAVDTMKKEGVLICQDNPTLPQFNNKQGLWLTSQLEMQWSDGGSSLVTKWMAAAKVHPLGTAAPTLDPDAIETGIINGYPYYYGCDDYIGNGSIKGSGDTAYTAGRYDGNGGHSECYLGVWNHPTDGRLFLNQNSWAADTYPVDPAGGPPCSVWIPEAEVVKMGSRLGGDGYLLSHQDYFPAQPELLRWVI